jgi:flavin reductase (DIM6/NTAB) family NADH-FMN oxidoreductase RutF
MNEERLKSLGQALGRVPSGLFILGVHRDGVDSAMLVSWVQQCAFDPPHVSVALKQGRELTDQFHQGSPFVLSVLEANQKDMLSHFGRGFAPGQPPFEGLAMSRTGDGSPYLSKALAYLECRVSGSVVAGDHVVFAAEVTDGALLNPGDPRVHIRKNGLQY